MRLVVLDPGIDVCKYRNAMRSPEDQFEFDGYERLEADMQREFGDVGWWLDTSDISPDQTADQLVTQLADRSAILEPRWNRWLRRLHGV